MCSTSRNKLQTIVEFRRPSLNKSNKLVSSLNHENLSALGVLRNKGSTLDKLRKSCEPHELRGLYSNDSAILDFHEIRNRNKLRRQMHDTVDLSDVNIEPIKERVSVGSNSFMNTLNYKSTSSLVRSSLNETAPLKTKDENKMSKLSYHTTSKDKSAKKQVKSDKFETLALATTMIQHILECIEPDESLQLAVLDECRLLVETKGKQGKSRVCKPKTGSVKLRQAIKKVSNKENNSIEYELAMSNIQDIFKRLM